MNKLKSKLHDEHYEARLKKNELYTCIKTAKLSQAQLDLAREQYDILNKYIAILTKRLKLIEEKQ